MGRPLGLLTPVAVDFCIIFSLLLIIKNKSPMISNKNIKEFAKE
jgi:hypothetical protein